MLQLAPKTSCTAMKYLPLAFLILLSCSQSSDDTKQPNASSSPPVGCGPTFTGEFLTVKPAPIIPGLEYFDFRITTSEPLAQKYFNQGWALAAGFNHAEAARSFYWATQEDPDCAMCYWGLAYVLGPNYNAGMDQELVSDAHAAIQTAQLLSNACTERERDLISAMSSRYPNDEEGHTSRADSAYSEHLRTLHEKYPEDNDIAALYAESVMDLHPWQLWDDNDQPYPWTTEVLDVLEGVRDRDPKHAISNHMYIHAVEASTTPERGDASAKVLETLVPGSGHLVHMPSHIYIRTGRYNACSQTNEKAIEVDSIYVSACHAAGAYPLSYYPHNFHFLCACAALEGRGKASVDASLRMQEKLDTVIMKQPEWGTVQHYYTIPWYIMVKFEMWDEILNLNLDDQQLVYPQAILSYAKGMAHSARGDGASASAQLKKLKQLSSNPNMSEITVWEINNASDLVNIASNVLEAEILSVSGNVALAEERYLQAIRIEDQLNYNEPPDWFFSVRHYYGDFLLGQNRYSDAIRIYREDLATFPDNGWALHGLYTALQMNGDQTEAHSVRAQFENVWEQADVELKGSTVL